MSVGTRTLTLYTSKDFKTGPKLGSSTLIEIYLPVDMKLIGTYFECLPEARVDPMFGVDLNVITAGVPPGSFRLSFIADAFPPRLGGWPVRINFTPATDTPLQCFNQGDITTIPAGQRRYDLTL
jgi:hypothetical protein